MLFEVPERLEFVDAPAHAAALERYRVRGYAMAGARPRPVAGRPMDAVEVHPPSAKGVEKAGVTVEYCSPRPAMG